MGIGSRDYVGSASFLASARGNAAQQQGGAATGQPDTEESAPGISPDDLLELIYNEKQATAQQLADRLNVPRDQVEAGVERLEELVCSAKRDNDETYYFLSESGLRFREYGRIAKSGI